MILLKSVAGLPGRHHGDNPRRVLRNDQRKRKTLAAVTIAIHVPTALRTYCAGATELFLSASTVRAALEQLEQSHPSLYSSVCDETGAVRRHVNLFVNNSFVRDREGLDAALEPGDVLTIMPAVSGG